MTKSGERKLTVAVLLSGREKFSAYYGGALARWTYEVYRHLTSELDVKVFGFPTRAEDLYPLPHETSHSWRLCKMAERIPVVCRYEDRLWLWSLRRRLQDVDVVHIHNRPQWALILSQLSLQSRIVVHLQNDHLGHWSAPMLDALAPAVDAVVTCSAYLRDTFAPRSSSLARKTHVVFNGVNTESFHPCENLREPKTIFFVGRFDPEKGVLQLVRAYALVLRDHPDAKLVIGGGTGFGTHHQTSYVSQVQAIARSIQQDCGAAIQFTGYIHHDRDLPAYFQRATVFTCPSLFQEPFGLVNAEAMACATATVGSNRGGIPEVLGDAGKVIDPEDIEGFANAVSEILAKPERRRQLGQAGYQRALQIFDWKVIASKWIELLRGLTK
jgi:glycosyltransferase involved in cell wall biosynthesis